MRIGIIGGTFNPPHMGHINAAKAAMEELSLSRLIFIPSHVPPHKELSSDSASPEQRLEMTRLVAEELSAEVSDMEISRGGTSYTVDTLRRLKEKYPTDELWFIMGTDMFLSIESWREPQEVMSLAKIFVTPRHDGDREALTKQAEYLSDKYGAESAVTEKRAIDISSTELRKAVSEGRLSEYLPKTVYEYIKKNSLYGV